MDHAQILHSGDSPLGVTTWSPCSDDSLKWLKLLKLLPLSLSFASTYLRFSRRTCVLAALIRQSSLCRRQLPGKRSRSARGSLALPARSDVSHLKDVDSAMTSRTVLVHDLRPCTRRPKLGPAKGQTVVEFALVVLLFFLLIFGVIDFGRLFFVQMSVQNAVQQAGRFAVTGNHLPDPNNPGQNLSRVASIVATAQNAAVGATITNVQVSSIKGGAGSAGGPGDTVTVSVTTTLQLITPLIAQFFPGGAYTFTSSVSFKNEPFPPANTK